MRPLRTRPKAAAWCGAGALALLGALGTAPSALAQTATGPARGPVAQRVTAAWVAFFAPSTPLARKVTLLQDGASFTKVIAAEARSPLGRSVAAHVSKVAVVSPEKANVTFSLSLDGRLALAGMHGQAVRQDGLWKVGAATFCELVSLEQVKAPACAGLAGGH